MLKFGYREQTVVLLVWIVVVMLLFRLVSDRQIAATLAGVGFVIWPILFLSYEYSRYPNVSKTHIVVVLLFLLLCAFPILFLRVLNWGTPFDQLSFVGVPGPMIHKVSNYIYILMLVSAAYQYFRAKRGGEK